MCQSQGVQHHSCIETSGDNVAYRLLPVSFYKYNRVYVFNTDFGRQIRANGDYGTDHGRGNYTILVGRCVNGGVYGEMFPANEIQGAAGSRRFDQQDADIEGRTSFERVLSAACDWTEAGTGAQVFPNAATSLLEPGVDLTGLLNA